MKKMKITPSLLIDIASQKNRETKNIRLNKRLVEYVEYSAKKKGIKLVDYYNMLILSTFLYERQGIDIFEVIKDLDSEF